MVKAAPGRMLLLAMTPVVAGCFDVHAVDPGSWLIDDFEGPDGYPSDGHPDATEFERWECRPLNSGHSADDNCEITQDSQRQSHVFHLRSTIDASASDKDFKRAEVATFAGPAVDLTGYERFSFAAKLVGAGGGLPEGTNLKAQLACTGVLTPDAGPSSNPCIVVKVGYKEDDWETHTPTLAGFAPPEDLGDSEKVNRQDCLASVDAIKITVDFGPQAPSNAKAEFDLYVDDISLEPRK
jgi:hypothetical protein